MLIDICEKINLKKTRAYLTSLGMPVSGGPDGSTYEIKLINGAWGVWKTAVNGSVSLEDALPDFENNMNHIMHD